MGDAGAAVPVARRRALPATAVVVAACQIGLAARVEYADDYLLTVAIAWLGALFLAWPRRLDRGVFAGLAPAVAGGLVAIGAVVAMVAAPGYHSFYRALPLVAGAGLAFAAAGPRAWSPYRGSLLLLALPLLDPPPKALHAVLDPVLIPLTTWSALALNRALGHPMVADEGHLLHMPHATLDVVDGCSGLWTITRLSVLAALVVALFPTSTRQRVALFATAFIVGFLVNAVRVGVLATTVLHADDAGFAYWHQGTGATLFAIASSATAGLGWWLLLRRGRSAGDVT